MTKSIPDFKAAVIDGRADAPRFKQRQLANLHTTLQSFHQDLIDALCTDTEDTRAEAEAQYALSMHAVKEHYASLNVVDLLEAEYSLANTKENLARRVPYGCAYIIPNSHSLLYSVVTPVAAAILAGNCVAIELPQTLRLTGNVLKKIFAKALDQDSFVIVESNPFDAEFKQNYVVSLNAVPTEDAESSSRSIRTQKSRVAAVVDRSSDLTLAAKGIVRARFAFSGQSSYAPDIVLVNEFSIKEFCSAVAQNALSFLTNNINGSAEKSVSKRSNTNRSSLSKNINDEEGVTVIASGSRGTVVLVHNREHKLLQTKITEPILIIHSISSMDDAIDFLNSSANGTPLQATYYFAAPAATKYLSQFISSSLSYANHIPTELLIGPPAPQGSTPQIHPRYATDLFSRTSPQFVSRSERSVMLAELVDGVAEVKTLSSKLDVTIQSVNEPVGGAIGFFEQGILLGLGLRLTGIAVASVALLKYGYPALSSRLRR